MVNLYPRKKEIKWMNPFLALILLLTPLVQAPYAHAEEGISPVQSTITAPTVTEATYDQVNPGAPQHLRLAEGGLKHNTAKIEWDFRDDPDDNNIQIYYADSNGYINWGNYYTRTLTGLKPETTYRIYITWNADSAKSNVLEFTTPADTSEYPDTPLTPPSALSVSDVTYDTVNLSWGSSPGAAGYDVYVNGGWAGGSWEEQDTTYKYKPDGGLIDGKTYKFEVGAQKEGYPVSKNSNSVTITWGELAAPEGLSVITATRSEVSLGWAPVPGATEYEVYQNGTLLGTTADVRYVADKVTEGQTYNYSVIAKNSLWISEASAEVSAVPGSSYNNISYFPNWAVYEEGRNFQPEDVVVSKLTHVNYAFADLCWRAINSKGEPCQDANIPLQSDYVFDGEMIIGDKEKDIDNLARFNAMKSENPNLKMMISVGGWSWSDNFSNMAKNEITRRAFADSAVDFLRAYNLDGLDIDWEYPVEGGEDNNSRGPEDKENFTLLMKTVREALDAAGSEDGVYYLLTIASAQGDNFVVNADLKNSVTYLDFINIMTYDYSGTWESLANHNSPLYYDRNLPKSSAPRNNVLGGLLGHLNGGVPEYKLLAGVPYYGKGWSGCPSPGEYTTCEGEIPKGSWEPGTFDFYDIQTNYVNKNGFTHTWNEAAKVSYVYNPTTGIFITYNDETTMKYTASMIKSLDIAGAMSWEVTGDRSNALINELAYNLPMDGVVNTEELAAPTNVSFEKVEDQKYSVHWNAVSGATHYEVFLDSEYIATTQKNTHTISVNANEDHVVRILATKKSGNSVEKVSNFTTKKVIVTSPEPYPQPNPSPVVTPTPTTPALESNQLEATVVTEGDTAKVTLNTENALKTIRASAQADFKIVVKSSAKQTEITLQQAVIAAIAKKSASASLTLIVNGAEQKIPVSLVTGAADIRVTTSVASETEAKAIEAWIKNNKIVRKLGQLKIEQISEKGTTEEIKGFGTSYVSEFIILDAKDVDTKHLAGFVYIKATGEFRPVPTLVTLSADGTAKVQMQKTAGGIYFLAQNSSEFTGFVSTWARADVEQAINKQILLPDMNGKIQVKENISREEVISILVRGLGLIPNASEQNFIDVSNESKYAKEIAAAKGASLVKGKTNGTFDGNADITRQELAVIIANVLQYAGKQEAANLAVLAQFEDQGDIAPYAKSSVAILVEKKLLNGVSVSRLAPQKNVTKEEAVVLIMRTLRDLNLTNK
ncbi:glycosyl hydrolase family 18 protein [Paenibacillus sp. Marseille-Q4541]|uniref:glycosyl hydrolase family 18 protein n=1 Tax=Paenibacillus sp. Marseille-Q4541 TaxID=2831522 RepID=UPI001BA65F71|nr:glycosyl hydrolase family 18 protein [Paenibacillus sp. Marseille-Q4541]